MFGPPSTDAAGASGAEEPAISGRDGGADDADGHDGPDHSEGPVGPVGPVSLGELGSFIREQRRRGHLSLRKLSELSGISNPYLSQIERGLRKPSAEILQQVARALHVSVESLYVRAGILEPSERGVEGPTVAEAVAADPELDDEQKRALLHIYESFRQQHRAGPVTGPAERKTA